MGLPGTETEEGSDPAGRSYVQGFRMTRPVRLRVLRLPGPVNKVIEGMRLPGAANKPIRKIRDDGLLVGPSLGPRYAVLLGLPVAAAKPGGDAARKACRSRALGGSTACRGDGFPALTGVASARQLTY